MAQPAIASPINAERRLKMTYEEWLAWADDNRLSEWVDGEVTVIMPPSVLHQDVVWFVSTLVGWHVRAFDLGRMFVAPFEMRLPDGSSREPDLLFVARPHLDRLSDQRLDGGADLVVEVVSPDSVKRDRADKLAAYQAAGIPEYWSLDPRPRRRRADFFQLNAAGVYAAVPPDAAGRYHPPVLPGFWLRPEWLWQDPLPDPLVCLIEIAPEILANKQQRTTAGGFDTGR